MRRGAFQGWLARRPLMAILALALTIRLVVALRFANVIAIDEIYQYLEPAHLLVFGQGLVAWEYQVGLRNWLIPLLLAAPMALAHWFFADPLAGLILIRICLCVGSLGIVWCAARLGQRFYGVRGLWVAGLCAALWPDLWLMAPHTLEEVFAADCLVPALYLVETHNPADPARRVAWAGFLLGLALVFRLQLAPAVAVAGIWLCRRDGRVWRVAVLAGVGPVAVAGGLDWVTWGQAFRSFWLNLDLNLFHGLATAQFGRNPALYYVHILGLDWLWSVPVLAALMWTGAKRLPVCGMVALIVLLTHMALAHKEIRFIFPALALGAVLAGVGLAGMMAGRGAPAVKGWHIILGAALLAGPFCSPLLASSLANDNVSFAIFESLKWETSGAVAVNDFSRAYLPVDILFVHRTLIQPMSDAQIALWHPGVILSPDPAFAMPGYRRDRCFPAPAIRYFLQRHNVTCVWRSDVARAGVPPAAIVKFSVPAAAVPFMVPDRFVADE